MKYLAHILATLTVMLSQMAYSQASSTGEAPIGQLSQEETLAFEGLASTNDYNCAPLAAAAILDDHRKILVGKLMSILDSTNADEVKARAVIILAQFRVPEAVPFLVQHLGWDDTPPTLVTSQYIPAELFTAIQIPIKSSLFKIGMPSIPALLDKITQTDDTNITVKCVSICQAIEGKDVTQFRLQGLLDKETDQTKKGRIQSALDALKNLKPDKWLDAVKYM